MSKQSVRKQKKKKARQRFVAKKKAITFERRRYARNYPQFVLLNPEQADPHFVELVSKAARSIDVRDRRLFSPWETNTYKMMMKYGNAFTAELFHELENDIEAKARFVLKLGSIIFSRIPIDKLLPHIPYNDVQVVYSGRRFTLKFRSLQKQSSQGGTIYFSS